MPIRVDPVSGQPQWKDVGADTWNFFSSGDAYMSFISGNSGGSFYTIIGDDDWDTLSASSFWSVSGSRTIKRSGTIQISIKKTDRELTIKKNGSNVYSNGLSFASTSVTISVSMGDILSFVIGNANGYQHGIFFRYKYI